MPLDRLIDRFERNTQQAQRSAKEQLKIILSNAAHLLKVRNGQKKLSDAREFQAIVERGGTLSPGQLSYIDGIYEATMKGAGFDSVNSHHDKPRGTLRFPKG